jgi:hypothetical protein
MSWRSPASTPAAATATPKFSTRSNLRRVDLVVSVGLIDQVKLGSLLEEDSS